MSALFDRISAQIAFGVASDLPSDTIARAVLEGMREPTEEMLHAAMAAAWTKENNGMEFAPKWSWKAMIDKALE